jgi:hypothetical protein
MSPIGACARTHEADALKLNPVASWNALGQLQFKKVVACRTRHKDCDIGHRIPLQDADAELELVEEATRLTNNSADCDPPDAFSRLAMRARISRRVNGSTGYSERGSIRLDCRRPEETFREVRTG